LALLFTDKCANRRDAEKDMAGGLQGNALILISLEQDKAASHLTFFFLNA